VTLRGVSGEAKSLIHRTWEAAQAIEGVARVVVATDDDRIKRTAEAFGAEVAMTSSRCRNGTERCAEAHGAVGQGFDIVVNLQGDAPLTPPWFIEALVEDLRHCSVADMATPVLQCDGATLREFREDRAAGRVGGTTVTFDRQRHALYFSKEVIPFAGETYGSDEPTPVWHHVGAYAYRASALMDYVSWPEGDLERLEGLEQLRFLENGRSVRCVEVQGRGRRFWELNNPEDVPRLEKMMTEMGME